MNSSIRTPNKRSSGRYGGPTTTPQQLFGSVMESIPEGEGSGWEQAWSNGRTPRRNARHGKGAVISRANAHSKSKTTRAAAGTATASTTTNGTASSASHRTSYTPSKKENLTNNNITHTNSNDHSSYVTQTKGSSLVVSPTAHLKAAKKVAKNLFKKVKGKNASTQTEFTETKDASTQTLAETVYVQHIPCVIRSVHDRTRGDLDRSNLGAGNLVILKSCLENENGNVFVCQFVGDDGLLKFQSDIPDKSDAHRHMKLVPGVENALLWDAYNTALKPVTLRSYSFYFDGGAEMFATILHMLGSVEIVKEFLSGGRFKLEKLTLPPHPIRKGDDDMDVNSDDEEHRAPVLSKEEAAYKYGEIQVESQFV